MLEGIIVSVVIVLIIIYMLKDVDDVYDDF
jgi:hypothetical protein